LYRAESPRWGTRANGAGADETSEIADNPLSCSVRVLREVDGGLLEVRDLHAGLRPSSEILKGRVPQPVEPCQVVSIHRPGTGAGKVDRVQSRLWAFRPAAQGRVLLRRGHITKTAPPGRLLAPGNAYVPQGRVNVFPLMTGVRENLLPGALHAARARPRARRRSSSGSTDVSRFLRSPDGSGRRPLRPGQAADARDGGALLLKKPRLMPPRRADSWAWPALVFQKEDSSASSRGLRRLGQTILMGRAERGKASRSRTTPIAARAADRTGTIGPRSEAIRADDRVPPPLFCGRVNVGA